MLGFRTLLCNFLVRWSSYCWSQPSILYRAWLEPELIFFTAAHKVPCVRFVTRTVLIVHWCFRYCWKVLTQCQGLLCWEAIQPGELTWIDQSNPYHVTSCLAIKLGGKFFRRSCCLETGWAAVCLWEVVSDCLSFTSMGRACFVPVFCFCFFFLSPSLINLSTQKFVWLLTFWLSPPFPSTGREQVTEIPAGVNPPHTFYTLLVLELFQVCSNKNEIALPLLPCFCYIFE